MPLLAGIAANGNSFRHELAPGRTTVGRSESSTIRLVDGTVSSAHAEIIAVTPGVFLLRDLGSTNGTYVNGQAISQAEISTLTRVAFGSVECELDPHPTPADLRAASAQQERERALGALAAELRELQRERGELRERLERAQAAGEEALLPLREKCQALEAALGAAADNLASRELEHLRKLETALAAERAEREKILDEKNRQAARLEAENARQQQQFAELQQQVSQLQEDQRAARLARQADLDALAATHEQQVVSLCAQQQETLAAKDRVIGGLETRCELLASAVAGLRESLSTQEKDTQTRLAQLAETEAQARHKLAGEHTAQRAEWEAQLAGVQKPADALKAEIERVLAPTDPVLLSEPDAAQDPVQLDHEEATPALPQENRPRRTAMLTAYGLACGLGALLCVAGVKRGNHEVSRPGEIHTPTKLPMEGPPAITVAPEPAPPPVGDRPVPAPGEVSAGLAMQDTPTTALEPWPILQTALPWMVPGDEHSLTLQSISRPTPAAAENADLQLEPGWPCGAPIRASLAALLEQPRHGRSDREDLEMASLAAPTPTNTPRPAAAPAPAPLTVLILGDSMSLCGFGRRLDEKMRSQPQVKGTFTYMASGTNPLSWLKEKPFTHVKTYSGFWSIESVPGKEKPKSLQDTYGVRRGSIPKGHTVPKLEDLLAKIKPDVLVVQNGTNLFGLFRDGRTVRPKQHGPILKSYIVPFVTKALAASAKLRKIYWVSSPISGRVSREVQDFVFEQVRECAGEALTIIDSRTLVSYPYRHMAPDREHFTGAEMNQWADKVSDIIARDLASPALPPGAPGHLLASKPVETAPPAPIPEGIAVKATLAFKTEPMPVKELLPYQESLVGYIYNVQQVIEGQYQDQRILVMHPAHIGLKNLPLEKYQVGKSYRLRLRELEGTAWSTIKARDDSGAIELTPYIQLEDELRIPGNRTGAIGHRQ